MFEKAQNLKPFKRSLFAVLIAFSVVLLWRGSWGLMDLYLFPNHLRLSYITSLVVGLVILAITHYWTKKLSSPTIKE